MTGIAAAGLLRIAKPAGPTSRAVVNRAVRRLGVRRTGHAGTLDPFAEGLLLVAWGRATGVVPYLQEYPKTYLAEAEFGRVTDTQDRTGVTLRTAPAGGLSDAAILGALPRFRGTVLQRPPMFSAVRHEGRRLYEIARAGGEVDRPERPRRVDAFELLRRDGPRAEFRIVCEGGTYIRTLIHDLGEALGPGACVTRLVRTAIGPHGIEAAVAAEAMDALDDDALRDARVAPADALPDWPALRIEDPAEVRAAICGSWRDPRGALEPGVRARLLDAAGDLIALVEGGTPPRFLRGFTDGGSA